MSGAAMFHARTNGEEFYQSHTYVCACASSEEARKLREKKERLLCTQHVMQLLPSYSINGRYKAERSKTLS